MAKHLNPSWPSLVWGLVVAFSTASLGQSLGPPALPTSYVEALLATTETALYLLTPDEASNVAAAIPTPVGATVLAGLRTGRGKVRVVFQMDEPPDQALGLMEQTLDAAGWQPRPSPVRQQRGFQAPSRPERETPRLLRYCSPDDIPFLVQTHERQGTTIVRVASLGPDVVACRRLEEASERQRLTDRLPDLVLPEGTESTVARGPRQWAVYSSGIVGAGTSSRVQLRSPLGAFDVVSHFGGQLAVAGWQLDAQWGDPLASGQVWRQTFDDGLSVIGKLTAFQLEPGTIDVEFLMTRASE